MRHEERRQARQQAVRFERAHDDDRFENGRTEHSRNHQTELTRARRAHIAEREQHSSDAVHQHRNIRCAWRNGAGDEVLNEDERQRLQHVVETALRSVESTESGVVVDQKNLLLALGRVDVLIWVFDLSTNDVSTT